MSREEICEIVLSSIVQHFGVARESVGEDTVAADVPGWDSFAHGQLLMEIESRLGRELPLAQTISARSVGDLIDTIDRPSGQA